MGMSFQQAAQSLGLRVKPSLMPHWLTHLGALGLFSVSVVDSSVIPLPLPGSTDLLLLWLVAHRGDPWLLAPCAIAGSIVGGYTTWLIGRRGGEAALQHYVPSRLLGRVVQWVQHHPILAVFIPALLPPPIPLLPFALASGALGVSRSRFLVVFGAARSLRYSFVAWMGVVYGRKVVRLFWNIKDSTCAQSRRITEACAPSRSSSVWLSTRTCFKNRLCISRPPALPTRGEMKLDSVNALANLLTRYPAKRG
jgi:membrane protein YqaA with SNARE-associated domain